MSDLQCPARLLFAAADGLDPDALLAALRDDRVSGVWASPAAEPAAAELAAGLGVGVQVDDRLAEPEPSAELVADVADLTRGETTLLLGGAGSVEVLIDGDGVRRRPWPTPDAAG